MSKRPARLHYSVQYTSRLFYDGVEESLKTPVAIDEIDRIINTLLEIWNTKPFEWWYIKLTLSTRHEKPGTEYHRMGPFTLVNEPAFARLQLMALFTAVNEEARKWHENESYTIEKIKL